MAITVIDEIGILPRKTERTKIEDDEGWGY
jgi:hypothetical protein